MSGIAVTVFHNILFILGVFFRQVSVIIFAMYTLSDVRNVMSADKVFVTMSLVNTLAWPLSTLNLCVDFMGKVSKVSLYVISEQYLGLCVQ